MMAAISDCTPRSTRIHSFSLLCSGHQALFPSANSLACFTAQSGSSARDTTELAASCQSRMVWSMRPRGRGRHASSARDTERSEARDSNTSICNTGSGSIWSEWTLCKNSLVNSEKVVTEWLLIICSLDLKLTSCLYLTFNTQRCLHINMTQVTWVCKNPSQKCKADGGSKMSVMCHVVLCNE